MTTTLDYYVVRDGAGEPEGLLAEEFLLAEDYSSAGLVSGGWSRAEARWQDASGTSRLLRVDAALRSRVRPVGRDSAISLYRDLGGADLPSEDALRAHFGAPPAPPPAPLRLGGPSPGFRETRIYRILFAGELPPAAVAGALRGDLGAFRWELRRVAGAAWGLDVTCDLAGDRDEAVGVLLRALTTRMRQQGLIPVTVDRFR